MAFLKIAEITFQAHVRIHPQLMEGYIGIESPLWTREGKRLVKSTDLERLAIEKIGEALFLLTIEQFDLFGANIQKGIYIHLK